MGRRPMTLEESARVRTAIDPEIAAASARLRAVVDHKGAKRPSSKSISRARIEEVEREAEEMRSTRDFRRTGALHLVALWVWCHEQTYGVRPAMTGAEWKLAGFAAGALVKQSFDGKADLAIPFVQWTWAEERRSYKWRKENDRAITPLGWRLQFGARHVVRWRANGGGR